MRPVFPSNNKVDHLEGYSKECSEFPLCPKIGFEFLSYIKNIFLKKFVHSVFDSIVVPGTLPSFPNHIIDIVLSSSKKQVIWSDTSSNIAFVKYPHSGRNRTIMKNPRRPVGFNEPSKSPTNLTVIPETSSNSPYPTRSEFWTMLRNGSVFVYLRPIALWKIFIQSLRSKILKCNLWHSLLVFGARVTGPAPFSFSQMFG